MTGFKYMEIDLYDLPGLVEELAYGFPEVRDRKNFFPFKKKRDMIWIYNELIGITGYEIIDLTYDMQLKFNIPEDELTFFLMRYA